MIIHKKEKRKEKTKEEKERKHRREIYVLMNIIKNTTPYIFHGEINRTLRG